MRGSNKNTPETVRGAKSGAGEAVRSGCAWARSEGETTGFTAGLAVRCERRPGVPQVRLTPRGRPEQSKGCGKHYSGEKEQVLVTWDIHLGYFTFEVFNTQPSGRIY